MKILVLSCGTGGGHNSAAHAIEDSLSKKGFDVFFIEYLDIINKKLKTRINNIYIKSTKNQGKIFKRAYKLGELYSKTRLLSPVYGLNSLNKKKLYSYIRNNGYDYVITTHLFAAEVLTAIKKDYPIHFIAVCTDYVCIPFWGETNPDYFIIPSEDLKDDFINKGIKEEKLLPFGIPVSETYYKNKSKNVAKQNVNLDVNSDYILILTGSMGFGNSIDVLDMLLRSLQNVNFIIACGNNKKMLHAVYKKFTNEKRVIALPYTNNISEYIKASKIVLTKPGGLTSTELAVLGIPFIHTMPIPGCENYNAKYFSDRKMAIKCDSIKEIVEKTKMLYNNENLQNELVENQNKYMCKNTCDNIATLILNEYT